jgi:hypothetical protein
MDGDLDYILKFDTKMNNFPSISSEDYNFTYDSINLPMINEVAVHEMYNPIIYPMNSSIKTVNGVLKNEMLEKYK